MCYMRNKILKKNQKRRRDNFGSSRNVIYVYEGNFGKMNKIIANILPCVFLNIFKNKFGLSCAGIYFTTDRDSVVGEVTRYGMDGPGIELRRRREFPHPSRPALAPTQQAPGLFAGRKAVVAWR